MSENSRLNNVWLQLVKNCYGFIIKSITDLVFIFFGGSRNKFNGEYILTNEIIVGGPKSFALKPTAMKIGRALFVPLILISHIYDHNTKISK